MEEPLALRNACLAILALTAASPALAQTNRTSGASVVQARPEAPANALLKRPAHLSIRPTSLRAALSRLADSAGVPVAFSPTMIPPDIVVACACATVTVAEALDSLLEGTGIGYTEAAGYVVILPSAASVSGAGAERGGAAGAPPFASQPAPEPGPVERHEGVTGQRAEQAAAAIAGIVVDAATGAPLAGAHIAVVGTARGTLTGEDGRFRIDGFEDGSEVLLEITRLGYRTVRRTVRAGATDLRFALEATAIELEEIVATGTIAPTRRREVPTPVGVITAEEIRRLHVQRIDELFRGTIPGIVGLDAGPTESPPAVYIRGASQMIGVGGGITSVFKVYIDGVEAADPIAAVMTLDPENIERLEVIRGPQAATLYGSEAMAGVIQVFTKSGRTDLGRPEITTEVSGALIGSDYAADGDHPHVQNYSASVSGGAEAFTYYIGGGYSRTADVLPGLSRSTGSLTAKLTATHGRFRATITGQHVDRSNRYPQDNPVLVDRFPEQFSYGGLYTLSGYDQQQIAVDLGLSATANWQHAVTLGISRWHTGQEESEVGPDSVMRVSDSYTTKSSVDYRTTYQLPLGSAFDASFSAGLSAVSYRNTRSEVASARRATEPMAAGSDGTVSRSEWTNGGIFGQTRIGFRESLYLTAGLRSDSHSHFKDENGREWAPNIGGVYNWSFGGLEGRLRAQWGRAIRAPSPTAKLGEVSEFITYLPNPDIVPEEQTGWDGGIDVYLHDRFSLGATYYDQQVAELISLVPQPEPSTYQYLNVGEITNRGWELEARLNLAPFRLGGTLTTMKSTVQKLESTYVGPLEVGKQVTGVPEWSAGASVTYSFLAGSASLSMTYVGERTNVDYVALYTDAFNGQPGIIFDYFVPYDAFTKLDLRLEQALSDRLSAFAWVENLNNAQEGEQHTMIPATGRTIGLGLRARF